MGRAFGLALPWAIVLSVLTVTPGSVAELREADGAVFASVEWFYTILFTVEYVLRPAPVGKPPGYAFSFFGVVDLVSILPTYA